MRVRLRSVEILCGVKRDRLVAKDVFTSCDVGWDGNSPGIVVCDHGVACPSARRGGPVDEASFIDFAEQEGGLVNGGAVAVAGR